MPPGSASPRASSDKACILCEVERCPEKDRLSSTIQNAITIHSHHRGTGTDHLHRPVDPAEPAITRDASIDLSIFSGPGVRQDHREPLNIRRGPTFCCNFAVRASSGGRATRISPLVQKEHCCVEPKHNNCR
jgi:hypothetical protein